MAPDCLADSKVYIDLLRLRKDPAKCIGRWAGEAGLNLVICGTVRLEVLRGVKEPGVYRNLSAFMDVMVNVPSTKGLWDAATELTWKLDRKGITIPGADAVIAASALASGASVMTSDAHFSRIEGLRVIAPPTEWLFE
jgi:predicted nucleic acid-binding protein